LRLSGNEVHRRPGYLREVDDTGEAGGGDVADRLPELAAVPTQPGPRHVQLDDDHSLTYQREEVRVNATFEKLTRAAPGRYRRADGSLLISLDDAAP
jgi:hypothetical protein